MEAKESESDDEITLRTRERNFEFFLQRGKFAFVFRHLFISDFFSVSPPALVIFVFPM